MKIDDIKSALTSDAPGVDANATFIEFKQKAGSEDPEAFLAYLHKSELITHETFTDFHAESAIELSELPTLDRPPGFDAPTQNNELHVPDPGATSPGTRLPAGVRTAERRHDLIGVIGEGAMGVVHVAKDRELRRKVAFKAMRPNAARSPAVRRFLSEVQITAQLDHPNIVPVYSLDHAPDGSPAYSMKLVKGVTLEEVIGFASDQVEASGAPDEDHGLAMRLEHFLKVCDAVSYAHNKGVLHRDLKPANIMVGRYNEVYVMDWGIARLFDRSEDQAAMTSAVNTSEDSRLGTQVGAIIGTPAYMSPEQANGELHSVGPRSDIFALGLILYELVLLKPAYPGKSANDVLARAKRGVKAPARPYQVGEHVAASLLAIIDKATAPQAASRYATVEDLADDIRRHSRDEPTTALPDTPARKIRRWAARNPRTIFLSMGLMASITVAALLANWSKGQIDLAHERAELAAQERRIADFRNRAAAQGQHIDNHVLRYEGQLERIAGAFQMAMEAGEPGEPGPFFQAWDFEDKATAPPDLAFSHHYNRAISPTQPVVHIPQGTPEAVWKSELSRIQTLDGLLKETWLHRPDGTPIPTDPDEQNEMVLAPEVVMEWAYVTAEKSGIISMFPGAPGWEPSYDPRTRPWYKQGFDGPGRNWGRPYADLMGTGRLISCIKAVYTTDGELLGVAGVDLEFNYLTHAYMRMDEPAFVTAYLLDDEGRVMVSTALEDDPFVIPATEEADAGLDYGLFDRPEVVTAASKRIPGYLLEDGDGRLLTWTPLHSIGWTYLAIADVERLGTEP